MEHTEEQIREYFEESGRDVEKTVCRVLMESDTQDDYLCMAKGIVYAMPIINKLDEDRFFNSFNEKI